MESEFNSKLNVSNVSSIIENQLVDERLSIDEKSTKNISENLLLANSGDHLDDFNKRLQEQLNMQIQSNENQLNQQHYIQQQYHQIDQPPILQPQPEPQLNLNQSNPQLTPNQSLNLQVQTTQKPATVEQSKNSSVNNLSPSNEIAKLTSPITPNFDTSSLFGWFAKQDFINKVAENAVNGFNSVLIILDPQMKEIRLAGNPSILVTSNHSFDICSVRDGFLDVFKRATVKSIDSLLIVETAKQLVGYSTAHKISMERIKNLRSNISIVPQNQIIVSIENFLYNFDDKWFDSDYILLDDPLNNILLSVHTQGTPIENFYIDQLKAKGNHKFRDDGFSIRLDSIIAKELNCSIGEWHKEYVGFDKSKLHYQAILLLSNLYKNKLKS